MSSKMYAIQHGNAPRCQHVFDTNLQCQSPALRGRSFCYWHQQNRKYRDKFTVPVLETAHAIQLTLSRITADLYDGKIDTKRATALYYGLSLAMFNVGHLSNPVSSDHVIELPPAMHDAVETDLVGTGIPACSSVQSTEQFTSHAIANADAFEEPSDAAFTPAASEDLSHVAWKSGASAPRCDSPQSGASAPVDTSAPSAPPRPLRGTDEITPPKMPPASDHQIPRSSAPQMTLPPEHFGTPKPLDPLGPFLLREQRFTPDEIRAYWTQHLPPEVRDLRSTSGEFFYEGPEWLPLTPEEIEFLVANKADNRGAGTPEQNFWYERLIKHHSCLNIRPPKPQEILGNYEDPEDDRSLVDILTSTIRKQSAKLATGS